MTRNAAFPRAGVAPAGSPIRPAATSQGAAPPGRQVARGLASQPLLLGSLLGLTLAALAAPALGAAPSEVRFTVELGDYWFSPSYIAVEVNSTVNITLYNPAAQPHEFEILGYGVEGRAEASANGSLVFLANKTGTFTILCGIPGHSTQGMVGRLIVVGPGFELNPLPQVAGQMVAVLEGVAEEYEAANVTGGAAQNSVEYNESRDFLEAAKDLWATIEMDAAAFDPSGAAKIEGFLSNLTARIEGFAPAAEVRLIVSDLVEELTEIGAAPTQGAASTWQGHLAALKSGLAEVSALYRAGDAAGADALLGQTYLTHVEPLEKALDPVDADLKIRMESEIIVELRGLIRSGASVQAVEAEVAEIHATLDQVSAALSPPSAPAGPWFALGAVAGLIGGTALGTLAFALYVRRLAAARPKPAAAEPAAITEEGRP